MHDGKTQRWSACIYMYFPLDYCATYKLLDPCHALNTPLFDQTCPCTLTINFLQHHTTCLIQSLSRNKSDKLSLPSRPATPAQTPQIAFRVLFILLLEPLLQTLVEGLLPSPLQASVQATVQALPQTPIKHLIKFSSKLLLLF